MRIHPLFHSWFELAHDLVGATGIVISTIATPVEIVIPTISRTVAAPAYAIPMIYVPLLMITHVASLLFCCAYCTGSADSGWRRPSVHYFSKNPKQQAAINAHTNEIAAIVLLRMESTSACPTRAAERHYRYAVQRLATFLVSGTRG